MPVPRSQLIKALTRPSVVIFHPPAWPISTSPKAVCCQANAVIKVAVAALHFIALVIVWLSGFGVDLRKTRGPDWNERRAPNTRCIRASNDAANRPATPQRRRGASLCNLLAPRRLVAGNDPDVAVRVGLERGVILEHQTGRRAGLGLARRGRVRHLDICLHDHAVQRGLDDTGVGRLLS